MGNCCGRGGDQRGGWTVDIGSGRRFEGLWEGDWGGWLRDEFDGSVCRRGEKGYVTASEDGTAESDGRLISLLSESE